MSAERPLTITAYSAALFSTWFFIEDLKLLLDAGDGVVAGLTQKARKIHTIALTHADRDHIAGLLQYQQLNARDGIPQILYPADSGSIKALGDFMAEFDPGTGDQITWKPVQPGDEVEIGKDLYIRVVPNSHIQSDQVKSLGFAIVRKKRKLLEQYCDLPEPQLKKLIDEKGVNSLTEVLEQIVVGYPGDTEVGSPEPWKGSSVLIHESTFLKKEDMPELRQGHSCLLKVLQMAKEAGPERLVLSHFSMRYSAIQILSEVHNRAARMALPFPVFVVIPGVVVRDLLNQAPVWNPLEAP